MTEKCLPNTNSTGIRNRLRWAVFFTGFVCVVEFMGGWLANSLALLGDAAHMLMDVFSLSLSWFALKVSGQPSTSTKTYGYHRMEIFAALVNGLLIIVMACAIMYEAVRRFAAPQEVQSQIVIVVAVIGLATNVAVIFFLKGPLDRSRDLNLKGAFFHVLGDTLASIGVIAGGIVMFYTGWYVVDVFLAAGISLLLVWGAKSLIAESFHILLEGVPKGISIQEVERELNSLPAILGIHELHVWSLCSSVYALSAHVLVNDQKINQAETILGDIQDRLREKFNISHSTIQFESNPCGHDEMLCEINH